jgi:hypothetical protein
MEILAQLGVAGRTGGTRESQARETDRECPYQELPAHRARLTRRRVGLDAQRAIRQQPDFAQRSLLQFTVWCVAHRVLPYRQLAFRRQSLCHRAGIPAADGAKLLGIEADDDFVLDRDELKQGGRLVLRPGDRGNRCKRKQARRGVRCRESPSSDPPS